MGFDITSPRPIILEPNATTPAVNLQRISYYVYMAKTSEAINNIIALRVSLYLLGLYSSRNFLFFHFLSLLLPKNITELNKFPCFLRQAVYGYV